MGDSSRIRWTQDALTELNTLALKWHLTHDQMLMLRQHAERRAYNQVAPSDVRPAWDLHRPSSSHGRCHGLARASRAIGSKRRRLICSSNHGGHPSA
jgi:hypothetical protein